VERCKNKDLLEELLKEMAGEFPQLSRIFVEERDQYMTHVLHTLLKKTTEDKIKAARKIGSKLLLLLQYHPLLSSVTSPILVRQNFKK
jgi:pheromone shutdown protein TraB